jgi:hypothetical protein
MKVELSKEELETILFYIQTHNHYFESDKQAYELVQRLEAARSIFYIAKIFEE